MSVGHNRSADGEAYALRLAKQRHKNERCKNGALEEDRNGQGAAFQPAATLALFRIAIHQACA
jgi:hypothetical protein